MSRDSIVITGIGLVTPLGESRDVTWQKIKDGSECLPNSMSPYTRFAPIHNLNGKHRIFSIASLAVREALLDAKIDLENTNLERVGCSVSVSKPIVQFPLPPLAPESVNQYIRRSFRIEGPSQNLIAACATGVFSLITAMRWLQENSCDMVIAGSVESSLDPLYISGFDSLGVLSDFSCPFDRRRNGFVMGEGAGILILERKEWAIARGAHIYAEILGGAVGSDSNHPTSFCLDGSSIATVLKRALKNSFVECEDVQYINCHGTGTKMNDLIETKAIKTVFGEGAYDLSLSSTKAATGHLLGASGSVEAAITALSIDDDFVPPTLHLEEKDSTCDLDYTPLHGQKKTVDVALSLSFGFGGHIGAIVLGKDE